MKKYIFATLGVLLLFTVSQSSYAGSPQEALASLVSNTGKASVVEGKDGWLFLKEELLHLSNTTFYGETLSSDPVPAIVDFNDQLQENGIDLLFVLIPPKALIYPDKLPGDFTKEIAPLLEKPYLELFSELEQKGVKVLDLNKKYSEARGKSQLYCKTDSHYSGTGLDLTAKLIAAEISPKPWFAALQKNEYAVEEKNIAIHGDLSQMLGREEKEELPLAFVTDKKTGKAVNPDPDSPVLLLGDSHTLVFSVGGDLHTKGAGLLDHLTAELGFPVDRIGVRGSGATPSRIKLFQRSRKDATFLTNKKMIIWCLSARELTGSGGWKKIPIAKK